MTIYIDGNEGSLVNVPLASLLDRRDVISDELMNIIHLNMLLDAVSSREDEEGNYDYSSISNIGMVYLYVHTPGRSRKEKTKRDYLRELLAFLGYVGSIGKDDIRQLSRRDIEMYQTSMELSYPKSNTRSKKIVIIDSFLTWCHEEGYLAKKVSRGLRPVKKKKEEVPERDIEESDLKEAILHYKDNPKVKSLLLILGTSGLRLNEVIQPAWSDLYYDRRTGKHYLRTITKRDKIRHAHIKDYALEALKEYRRRVGLGTELDLNDKSPFYPSRLGKRYTLSSISTILSKHMAAAGLTSIHGNRVTPHFLRHFFSQSAYAKGAPLDWISETLDHSSTSITKNNYLSRQMKKDRDVSEFVDLDVGF